jgi:hypothetical protein
MWIHYLIGIKFVLMTNNSGLRYLFYHPKLNSRHAKWMALLSEFDFEIKHIKGKENRVVDSLSRSKKVIHMEYLSSNTCESDINTRVKSAQETDEFFKTVKTYLEQESTGL